MIKTTLVAMTVLGCDCHARLCEFIAETPAQWASVAECEAALKAQLVQRSDLDYPLISGICRPSPDEAQLIALSQIGGQALATRPAPTTTASTEPVAEASIPAKIIVGARDAGRTVFRKTADGYVSVKSRGRRGGGWRHWFRPALDGKPRSRLVISPRSFECRPCIDGCFNDDARALQQGCAAERLP